MELHRLLYVEDEPDIREVAAIALQDLGGFEVSLCARGEEAVGEARRFHPQLILLDVMMPSMDGIATFNALQAQSDLADIPVVFLTAKAQAREVADLMALGAMGVIAKPFEASTLADEVRQLWVQHATE